VVLCGCIGLIWLVYIDRLPVLTVGVTERLILCVALVGDDDTEHTFGHGAAPGVAAHGCSWDTCSP
jgi:hypothetical protein